MNDGPNPEDDGPPRQSHPLFEKERDPLEMREIRKDCAHHGKSCPCGACRALFNYDLMIERFEKDKVSKNEFIKDLREELAEEKRAASTAEAHARTALQQFRDAKDIPEEEARKLFTGMAGGASESRYRERGLALIEALDSKEALLREAIEVLTGVNCCPIPMKAEERMEEFLTRVKDR